jgi:hypothetical protein
VLVIAQEDDPLHAVGIAVELTAALPDASLLVLPPGGVFWTAGLQTARALAGHLSGSLPEPTRHDPDQEARS